MVILKKSLHRRTFLRGAGAALTLPLLDAMIPALGHAAETTRPIRLAFIEVPNGIMMDKWTPASEGAGFRAHADPGAPGAVPRPHARAERSRSESGRGVCQRSGRRSSARLHRMAHGRARENDLGRRSQGRYFGRSGRGTRIRQVHAARLARSRPRIGGNRGRLRVGLFVRVLQHDLLAQRHDADADGKSPARDLRAPVRRYRHHRSETASGAHGGEPLHPRCGCRGRDAPARAARTHAIAERSTSIWRRSATSSGAFSSPKPKARRSCRSCAARSASRRCSRTTTG